MHRPTAAFADRHECAWKHHPQARTGAFTHTRRTDGVRRMAQSHPGTTFTEPAHASGAFLMRGVGGPR